MDQVRLSFPITKFTKLDDGSLEVEGVATDESIDSQGDVLTYDGSKKAFGGWRGNVREQHDVHKAVGKALDVVFDDDARAITVKSRISSGAADTITKIEDGVLTCYSVGGGKPTKVSKKTINGKLVRVVEEWPMNELSVVDAGANPNATFQLVKADGIATELLATDTLPAEVQDASNRFAAAILKAVKDERGTEKDEAAGEATDDASDTPDADAPDEPPDKCDKCDAVHPDGVDECDKAALASAITARAKKGVEEAKAKHKVAQAKEQVVGAQAKLEEVKGGGEQKDMEAAKAAGAEGTEKVGGPSATGPAADPDIAPELADLDPNPKCTCCDGGKCTGTDKCCKVCKCAPTDIAAIHLADGDAAPGAIKKSPRDLDLQDAVSILTRIRSLRAIEASETDVEVAQLALLDAADDNIRQFIVLEAKEPPADDAAEAAPIAYSAKTSSAVLLKSLFEAFTKKPAADVPADLFKVNHGHQLAEGIGQGLKKSLEPLSKAVAELKVGFDELKGGSANEKLEKAVDGIRETVDKIAKQPAVLMPLRNRAGLDELSQGPSLAPSARADVLLKWAGTASADTRAYLEQCARTERQS
jgi:hypothetical protein